MDNLPTIAAFSQQELTDIAGQLAPRSRRIYAHDAAAFAKWMLERGLTPITLTRSDVIAYRAYLGSQYAASTAGRMFSVARRLLDEQIANGTRQDSPFTMVKGFKGNNETTHTALTATEAKNLMSVIDTSKKIGKRDYALIGLLLRTGIRRAEAAALDVSDLGKEQGHSIAFIQHGKGDKRRIIKIPNDVQRTIDEYIKACQIKAGPIFVRFYKGDTPGDSRLTDKAIEKLVKSYGEAINVTLTPHGLRASFITLALEGKAQLQQVQYAAGHADPRTTERYQKRKLNLDDNAVDYIHL